MPPTWKCDQYRWPLDEARPGPVRSWTSREAELVSPSGDLIAQRTTEKSIDLIETATGRTRQSLPIAEPSSLHFSADGRFLVAASGESGTVWELGSGEPIARFPVTSSATTFEFIPNGRAVMSMDVGGGPIAFHDAVSGRHWSLLPADDDHVHHKDPAVSPDGKWLVTRSGPGVDLPHEPTLWEIDTGRQVVAISNPGSLTYPRQDCFSPDSRSVLMNSEFGAVRWTLGERTDLQPVGHAPEAWAAAFRPDISALATGGDDGRVLFWDRETSALIDGFEAHEGMVSTIAFSKDGSTLLTGSLTDADNLTLWDAATRTAIARFTGHERHVRCAAISPCGNFVASGADDHLARIWDARTGATRHLLSGHEDRVRSLAFSRDGLTLVTASEDKTLRFWNIKTGECTRTIRDEGEVTAVAFSPNGSSIAWVDKVGRVTVKEVGIESRPERVFEAQVGEAWALAFSPGGETLAVAGGNGVVQLWSPETGQEILALEGEGDIRGLAFASDGSALAACRMNGGVQIWRADPEPSKKD